MAETLNKAEEVINGGIVRPAPMNARMDALQISPHIQDAEIRWVKPVLGKVFYTALISARTSGVSNYNADLGTTAAHFPSSSAYEALWTGHLRDFCGLCVMYEAQPFITLQQGSNGLFLNDTQHGQNAGMDGLKFIQDSTLQKIEVRTKELKTYLCDNAASLPDFQTSAVDYCPSGCSSAGLGLSNRAGIVFY